MDRQRAISKDKVAGYGLLGAVASALAAAALGGAAHADTADYFPIKSPSGNIACNLDSNNGVGTAVCNVAEHTWVAPPRPANCRFPHDPVFYLTQYRDPSTAGGPIVSLDQCGPGNSGIYLQHDLQTLEYGQTRSVGAITCDSEPSGITCTDTSTGHFFRLSRDSYDLG
jgi:hypothetical protein